MSFFSNLFNTIGSGISSAYSSVKNLFSGSSASASQYPSDSSTSLSASNSIPGAQLPTYNPYYASGYSSLEPSLTALNSPQTAKQIVTSQQQYPSVAPTSTYVRPSTTSTYQGTYSAPSPSYYYPPNQSTTGPGSIAPPGTVYDTFSNSFVPINQSFSVQPTGKGGLQDTSLQKVQGTFNPYTGQYEYATPESSSFYFGSSGNTGGGSAFTGTLGAVGGVSTPSTLFGIQPFGQAGQNTQAQPYDETQRKKKASLAQLAPLPGAVPATTLPPFQLSPLGGPVNTADITKGTPELNNLVSKGGLQGSGSLRDTLNYLQQEALRIKGLIDNQNVTPANPVVETPEQQQFLQSLPPAQQFDLMKQMDALRQSIGLTDLQNQRIETLKQLQAANETFKKVFDDIEANPDLPRGLAQRRLQQLSKEYAPLVQGLQGKMGIIDQQIAYGNEELNRRIETYKYQQQQGQSQLDYIIKALAGRTYEALDPQTRGIVDRLASQAGYSPSIVGNILNANAASYQRTQQQSTLENTKAMAEIAKLNAETAKLRNELGGGGISGTGRPPSDSDQKVLDDFQKDEVIQNLQTRADAYNGLRQQISKDWSQVTIDDIDSAKAQAIGIAYARTQNPASTRVQGVQNPTIPSTAPGAVSGFLNWVRGKSNTTTKDVREALATIENSYVQNLRDAATVRDTYARRISNPALVYENFQKTIGNPTTSPTPTSSYPVGTVIESNGARYRKVQGGWEQL